MSSDRCEPPDNCKLSDGFFLSDSGSIYHVRRSWCLDFKVDFSFLFLQKVGAGLIHVVSVGFHGGHEATGKIP